MFKPWETAEETRSGFAAMGIPGTSTVMSAIAISVLIAILPAPTMGHTGTAIAVIVTTIAAIAARATTGSRWQPSPPAR